MPPVETDCPVCGRYVLIRDNGTLYHHFTSAFNQDNPDHPTCIGGGMLIVAKEKLDHLKAPYEDK